MYYKKLDKGAAAWLQQKKLPLVGQASYIGHWFWSQLSNFRSNSLLSDWENSRRWSKHLRPCIHERDPEKANTLAPVAIQK